MLDEIELWGLQVRCHAAQLVVWLEEMDDAACLCGVEFWGIVLGNPSRSDSQPGHYGKRWMVLLLGGRYGQLSTE
jgi:hypothetical protein